MNTFFIIKHCLSNQLYSNDKPLSYSGKKQAINLCNYLMMNHITRIYSSEKKRAYQSILTLSKKLCLPVICDNRLNDKYNANINSENYFEYMKGCFSDFYLYKNNDEPLFNVKERINSFLMEIQEQQDQNIVIATHGVCVAFLINKLSGMNAFNIWQKATPGILYKVSYKKNQVCVDKIDY